MNPRLHALFVDYQRYHRTVGNKRTHQVAIPLIMLSILALLTWVRFGSVGGVALNLGQLVGLGVLGYYASLNLRLFLGMLVVIPGLYVLAVQPVFQYDGPYGPWPNLAVFVVSWVIQLAGHAIWEKKRPAFAQNLEHLLVGPLWILADVIGPRPPAIPADEPAPAQA
ncbi:MAG: Mpo1-like protein [Myxococcota bacterium]